MADSPLREVGPLGVEVPEEGLGFISAARVLEQQGAMEFPDKEIQAVDQDLHLRSLGLHHHRTAMTLSAIQPVVVALAAQESRGKVDRGREMEEEMLLAQFHRLFARLMADRGSHQR